MQRRLAVVVVRDDKVAVLRRLVDGQVAFALPTVTLGSEESDEAACDRALAAATGFRMAVRLTGDPLDRDRVRYVVAQEVEPLADLTPGELGPAPQLALASRLELSLVVTEPTDLAAIVGGLVWPLSVRPVLDESDRIAVRALWQTFMHDLAGWRGTTPGPGGFYPASRLEGYLEGGVSYLALQGNRPVGFALAREDQAALGDAADDGDGCAGGGADRQPGAGVGEVPGVAVGGNHGASGSAEAAWVMGEFFVVPAVRGAGVAEQIVTDVLLRHAGRWTVWFQRENVRAAGFWTRCWRRLLSDVEERSQPVPGKPYLPTDAGLTGVR